jgi:metalloendopeptidase OMA1, mitochondrial
MRFRNRLRMRPFILGRDSSFQVQCLLYTIVLCIASAGCAKNPYTGRHQLLMIPASQEQAMGLQAYKQVLSDPKINISKDPKEVEPVQRVAARVIEAAKKSKYAELANKYDWQVSVIKDDRTQNAFALPGGKIAVYTGIFPVAQNEAGLAAIMGHEVVHALARHGAERMSQGLVAQGLVIGATLGAASQGVNPQIAQMAGGALAQYGYVLPYSRKHESEADYIGLLLAADAGYDPQEAVRVWERMEQLTQGQQPPQFLSTHPSHGTRIKQLQEQMPEALARYEAAPHATAAQLPAVSTTR